MATIAAAEKRSGHGDFRMVVFSTLQAWLNWVKCMRLKCQKPILHFILDRRDRLKIIRDRQSILTTHLTIAVGGALNRVVHESAHVIQIWLRTGYYQIRDFLAFPSTNSGFFVGGDVGDELAKGTNVFAGARH